MAPIRFFLLVVLICLGWTFRSSKLYAEPTYMNIEFDEPYVSVHSVSIPIASLETSDTLRLFFAQQDPSQKATLSEIVDENTKKYPKRIEAAINASFDGPEFLSRALPRGPLVQDGVPLASSSRDPTHPAFGLSDKGKPWIAHLVLELALSHKGKFLAFAGLNVPRFPGDIVFTNLNSPPPVFPEDREVFALVDIENNESAEIEIGKKTNWRLSKLLPDASIESEHVSNYLFVPKESSLLSDLNEVSELEVTLMANAKEFDRECAPRKHALSPADANIVVGAGRILLEGVDGVVEVPPYVEKTSDVRAPRSGICWNRENVYFVVVDGIRPGFWRTMKSLFGSESSQGMTILQFAEFMKTEFACHCGIELDGGKSSTLYFDDGIVSSPATGAEYPVKSALAVIARK